MKPAVYIFLVIAGICATVLSFRTQLWQYLFDPEGLSLAPSEFCVTNGTDGDLVLKLSVTNGATSTTYLLSDETACSAAASKDSPAMAEASIEDGQPPYCRSTGRSGETKKLVIFDPPSNCVWE